MAEAAGLARKKYTVGIQLHCWMGDGSRIANRAQKENEVTLTKLKTLCVHRLSLLRKVVTVLWVLTLGLKAQETEGVSLWVLTPLISVAVGYVLRPRTFRPLLVSTITLILGGVVVYAHLHFRTILMIPVIAFACLGVAGVIISYYGRGIRAFFLGLAFSLISGFAFPENPVFASPRSVAACSVRVEEMERRLSKFVDAPFLSPSERNLPQKPAWPPVEKRPYVLDVGPKGRWFGEPLSADLEVASAELSRRVGELVAAGTTPNIYLAADVDEQVEELAVLLRQLPQVNVWVLAIQGPGYFDPPPSGAVDFAGALDASNDPAEMARILGDELSRRLGPCRPAAKPVENALTASPELMARLLVEGIAVGLRDCQCGYVDLEALEYLVARTLGVPPHRYSAGRIRRDSDGRLMIPDDAELTLGEWVSPL